MSIEPEVYSRYAGMHVPRYTSYPTAPHFSQTIGEADYREWLRQLDADEPVSVYIHIPFCRQMCWYCGCHTTVVNREEPVTRYVAALAREIRRAASAIRCRPKVGHLHWGGGTPTLLTPESIKKLSGELVRAFDTIDGAEIAIEIDPRTLTKPIIEAFAQAGVNRASLGVQSFDPRVQAAINRVQTFETTARASRLLRRLGIRAINLDLIYGLPFQTVTSCVETVEQALRLRPDRLAIFGYAHVPDFKPHQRKIDEAVLPGAAQRQEQFCAMAEVLVANGYVQIGLDHFALPGDPLATAAAAGTLRRNFQGYTTDRSPSLLGFGASAIGRLPQGYVQNAPRIREYESRIDAGELPIVRGWQLTDEDRRRSAIIEQLMCDYKAVVDDVPPSLRELEADGLVRRSGKVVEIADDARPLVRVVAAAFDAYLPKSAVRHALAI